MVPTPHGTVLASFAHELPVVCLPLSREQPDNAAAAVRATPNADEVLQWQTGKGLVVLKKTIRESDQPALLWLGSAQ